jgi:hypothetical protein
VTLQREVPGFKVSHVWIRLKFAFTSSLSGNLQLHKWLFLDALPSFDSSQLVRRWRGGGGAASNERSASFVGDELCDKAGRCTWGHRIEPRRKSHSFVMFTFKQVGMASVLWLWHFVHKRLPFPDCGLEFSYWARTNKQSSRKSSDLSKGVASGSHAGNKQYPTLLDYPNWGSPCFSSVVKQMPGCKWKGGTARPHLIMEAFSRSDPPPPSVAEAFSQSEPNSGFNSQTSIQPKDNC